MRVPFLDQKTGEAKVVVETLEDLWHLERIIEPGDILSSSTLRTVKIGAREEKKPVFISLSVEKISLAKYSNQLRLTGKIISGKPEEFVQIGRYHTIEVGLNDSLYLKKRWKAHHIQRLKDAEKEAKRPIVRIILLDEEKALTATIRGYGADFGPEFYNHASKKEEGYDEKTQQYYAAILKEIENYKEKTIVAGPGFAKDNLKKYVKEKNPKLLEKLVFESCSNTERSGINELLKRGVISRVIGEGRLENEMKLIEEFLIEIRRESGLAVYGFAEVKKAIEANAVDRLLVLDETLRTRKDVEDLLEKAERSGVMPVIFSAESDSGFQLKGFGGLAALLRFRL